MAVNGAGLPLLYVYANLLGRAQTNARWQLQAAMTPREISTALDISHHITPASTLRISQFEAQRSAPSTAELGASSPPRPTTLTRS
jgi:hypothetical protein